MLGSGVFVVPLAHYRAFWRWACCRGCARTMPLAWSFWGAATACWPGRRLLAVRARSAEGPQCRRRPPRAQHYVQSFCHFCVYSYWGWYWPPVYDFAPLLAAQLLFAYVFDILLAWSRREEYVLGFGPFPIVFSTNLFLWFKDDWFGLQFR